MSKMSCTNFCGKFLHCNYFYTLAASARWQHNSSIQYCKNANLLEKVGILVWSGLNLFNFNFRLKFKSLTTETQTKFKIQLK